MAADAPVPLMSTAELKPLLKLAHRRGVSCAVAMTRDRQATVLLHRRLKPRKLAAELRQKARGAGLDLDAATVRFGRATVDGASDGTKVTFTVNKAPPGPMRMLVLPQMRSAGHQRCEFVVDEALETEAEDGEDANDGDEGAWAGGEGAMEGGGSLHGPARTPSIPPGAPSNARPGTAPAKSGMASTGPGGTPAPDGMAAARVRLTQLALRARDVLPGNPPGADAIRTAAARARQALASGDVAAMNAAAGVMEQALGPAQPSGAAGAGGGQPGAATATLQSGADARAGAPRDRTGWVDVAQARPSNTATDAGGVTPAAASGAYAPARGALEPGRRPHAREVWRYGPPLLADIRQVQPGTDVSALHQRIEQLYGDSPTTRGGLQRAVSDLSDPAQQSPQDRAATLAILDEYVRREDTLQPAPDDGFGYSPERPGYHTYTSGPHVVCPAELRCSREEMADQMARFAVPGQSPDQPVQNGKPYSVYDPFTGMYAGGVFTTVSPDGLTTQNRTRPGHLLHDGQITREATQNPDGSWSVFTIGSGNNFLPLGAEANALAGPRIFERVDEQMRQEILRHHGGS